MSEPQILYFTMRRARVLRATLFVFMGLLVAIPVFALITGQDAGPTAGAIFVALMAIPFMWFYYRMAIKPCFWTGIALEIHPNHLVVATLDGMKKIPKQHILWVEGPHHTFWMQRATMSITSDVVLGVTADYKQKGWLGRQVNPALYAVMIEGPSEWDAMSALKSWHAVP